MEEEHTTTHVAVKTAKVDDYILPVVQWLNDFPGVTTQWSCEGVPGDDVENKPYVVFCCEDTEYLSMILKSLKDYARVEIEFYTDFCPVRFCIKFDSKQQLQSFIALEMRRTKCTTS